MLINSFLLGSSKQVSISNFTEFYRDSFLPSAFVFSEIPKVPISASRNTSWQKAELEDWSLFFEKKTEALRLVSEYKNHPNIWNNWEMGQGRENKRVKV